MVVNGKNTFSRIQLSSILLTKLRQFGIPLRRFLCKPKGYLLSNIQEIVWQISRKVINMRNVWKAVSLKPNIAEICMYIDNFTKNCTLAIVLNVFYFYRGTFWSKNNWFLYLSCLATKGCFSKNFSLINIVSGLLSVSCLIKLMVQFFLLFYYH